MIVGIQEFHTGKDIARHELVLEDGWKFGNTHTLPDGSGVLFDAGWPGDGYGTYLVEWLAELK